MIAGNELIHGGESLNKSIISYGAEKMFDDRDNRLIVLSNTLFNRYLNAIFVHDHGNIKPTIQNNLIGGAPVALSITPAIKLSNWNGVEHGLTDPRNNRFDLRFDAVAIDTGQELPNLETYSFETYEYVHPLKGIVRRVVHRPDIGAHERCGLSEFKFLQKAP